MNFRSSLTGYGFVNVLFFYPAEGEKKEKRRRYSNFVGFREI